MAHDPLPHETSALHELAERARKQPKLLTKAEVEKIANFVLKGAEHASEEQKAVAKKTLHNPEGVEASDIVTLAEQILARK
ncbi:hypothetical protein [Acetobacter oeni]|uniref:Uncharacterized protein n=1 Tax=Acetobacter oeni TaxID=304077 RepID=A0A511XJA8_9PROT|nr:hypothetical protein [Acetobacter oeni]MBB3882778.1 hypothetical protein [Acetobacter oeni]NHO18869.1 hypothetical protein [Acetobacter oeni]GEN63035.1 hypothetical protein AOE01nite_12590 [Acetobacter oeni]